MLYYNIPPAPTLTLPGRSSLRLVDSIKPVLQELRSSGRVEGPSKGAWSDYYCYKESELYMFIQCIYIYIYIYRGVVIKPVHHTKGNYQRVQFCGFRLNDLSSRCAEADRSHKPYLNPEYPTFLGLLIVMISLDQSAKL